MNNVHKFVTHAIPAIDELSNAPVYKLLKHFNDGGTLKTADKALVGLVFNALWNAETYQYGYYKLQGYIFDFSDFLKTYLVKTKYDGWQEYKAFNKTWLRANAVTPSHIMKIVELPA